MFKLVLCSIFLSISGVMMNDFDSSPSEGLSDDLVARILRGELQSLEDTVVEFLSCWDSVSTDVKQSITVKRLVDFERHAKYVRNLQSRAPFSYSALEAISAQNVAKNTKYLLEKCQHIENEMANQDNGKYAAVDNKVVEFLSCWDSVPSDVREGLTAKRLVDFEMFAKYARDLHIRSPSSYSSLNEFGLENLAKNSEFLLKKCVNIENEKAVPIGNAEQNPLADKVAEFLSCWDSVPSDKKDSLPAKRRMDFEMHAKIVGKLHSQAPSSYSSLDATAAHNLAMNSDYLLGKCMNIDAEMVNHSEEVEKDENEIMDDKVVKFLSCWDSVPTDVKESLPVNKQMDFRMFAKYAQDLHLRAPTSYSSLDATAAHNLAMNSDYLLEKCENLGY